MTDPSSGDELGNYDPTTPRPKKPVARSTGTNNAAAGPSFKPAPKRGAKRGKKAAEAVPHDVVDLISDTDVQVAPAPKKPKSAQTGRATAVIAKTEVKSKIKGKAKVDEQSVEEEAMSVDEAEVIEEVQPPPRPSRPTKGKGKTVTMLRPPETAHISVAEHDRLQREVERLRKQLEASVEREQTLVNQLEEVFRVRNTEAEELLAQERENFEARLQAHDLLNAEQAKLISASNSGMLYFLSREDADKEKKEAEDNVLHWKRVAAKKDEEINEYKAQVHQLETELKLEIERAKTLTARNPPLAGRRADADDRSQAAVIAAYESMTNILIVNASIQPSPYPGKEEFIYRCIFTNPTQTEERLQTLNFTLHDQWQVDEEESSEPIRSVIYTPRDLDKERPELVERLDYFAESFSFSYDQFHVFFRSLSEQVDYKGSKEEEVEVEVEEA